MYFADGTTVRVTSTLPRLTDGVKREVKVTHMRRKPRKGKPRHRNISKES